jgi:hypothetical protein
MIYSCINNTFDIFYFSGVTLYGEILASSLIIHRCSYKYKTPETIDNIHLILPHHTKHLQIPVIDVNQIEPILERCKNLSTIRFDYNPMEPFWGDLAGLFKKVINYFTENIINTTCQGREGIVVVWLGRKKTKG